MRRTLLAILVATTPVFAALSPPLTEQQLAAMEACMNRELGMYAGFDIARWDPRDADAFVSRLAGGWMHGIPRQLLDAVAIAPSHFAPAVREQLMRLPGTLEEYLRDVEREEPRYSITLDERMRPLGPRAGRLLIVASYLGRAHAEPILQEFFDRVNPLALEAQRRYWEAQDAGDPRAGEFSDIWIRVGRGRSAAISAARSLHSPIFIDDVLAMLESDDAAARYTGAVLADRYVLEFAAERPDALARVVSAATDLNASENPRLAPAARSLTKRIRQLVEPEPLDAGPTPRERNP